MIKVLNLYAGIGGNRKIWDNVKVLAVENNAKIAGVYKNFFPEDEIYIGDAHQFLLDNYKDFDFIWGSPPCPTHSRTNMFLHPQGIVRYPDMRLYQEIILLRQWCKAKWVIENVISYYEPLIKPVCLGRHYFWANFVIPQKDGFEAPFNIANARATTRQSSKDDFADLEKYHAFNLSNFDVPNKRLLLRNCVHHSLGKYVFDCAFNGKQTVLL